MNFEVSREPDGLIKVECMGFIILAQDQASAIERMKRLVSGRNADRKKQS